MNYAPRRSGVDLASSANLANLARTFTHILPPLNPGTTTTSRGTRTTMKRQLLFSAATTIALAAAACSGESESTSGINTTATTNTTATSGATDGQTSTSGQTTNDAGGTATGGQGSGTGASTGTPFVVPPDGGNGAMECDVWTQDCPEGQKCMPWANDGGNAWNATKCSPIDPNPKQPGDECSTEGGGVSGVDNCDKSAMCWNVDPEMNIGYCVAFCTGTPDMPGCAEPDQSCLIANDGVLIICLPACDPLLQDCQDNELCLPNTAGDGFACVLDASGGMGTAGTPCEYANACNAGLICANAEFVPGCDGSAGCCAPYCDLTDPNASSNCANAFTTTGADCVPFFEMGMAPPGHEDVGVCIIPQ